MTSLKIGTVLIYITFVLLPSGSLGGTISIVTRNGFKLHQPHSLKPEESPSSIGDKAVSRGANSVCQEQVSFVIEDAEISSKTDSLSIEELESVLETLDNTLTPHVRLQVRGIPCELHTCCQHTLLVRPKGSDVMVLKHAIGEYTDFLVKVRPSFTPSAILEGGGNIGIATMVFANFFPNATIVVMEPQPQNCMMLKANTLALPNVRVHCKGLWSRSTTVAMVAGGDGFDWGWHIEEVAESTPDAVRTTTVENLLMLYGLDGFDFVKLDIEGAEFSVFGKETNQSWLGKTKLLAAEIHDWIGRPSDIVELMLEHGLHASKSGEYTVFAEKELHSLLSTAD